jgi:hypothetical protein
MDRKTRNRIVAVTALTLIALLGVGTANVQAGRFDPYNRRVTVINDTSTTMWSFYASNVGRLSWEEDIFGPSVLHSGRSVVVNIDDGTGYCLYDLKAVFSDGRQAIRHNFNVCEMVSWTIYD